MTEYGRINSFCVCMQYMYMHAYIYMHACSICICMHPYIICICMHPYIICTCMHAPIVCVCMHACSICTCIHAYIMCICMHAYIVCICMHTWNTCACIRYMQYTHVHAYHTLGVCRQSLCTTRGTERARTNIRWIWVPRQTCAWQQNWTSIVFVNIHDSCMHMCAWWWTHLCMCITYMWMYTHPYILTLTAGGAPYIGWPACCSSTRWWRQPRVS